MARFSDSPGAAARRTANANPGRPDDYDDGSGAAPANTDSVGFGLRGWLRWFWRQLTSMRVALILLLLLAVATIPGSLLPQRSADPNGVVQYEAEHPTLFPILDAFPIQAFDVYSSVWFSSIYLLLFISLIGCVLPRVAHHWRALRSAPPRTPVRLQRMAGFAEQRLSNPEASPAESEAFAERAIVEAESLLRRQKYRTEIQRVTNRRGGVEISVSAERGYLRETGNLVFHLALVGVLISVAIGGLFSFNGQKVLVEGESLVNQLIDYDSATSGTWFDANRLEPFGMRLDSLEVDYVTPDEENINAQAIGLVREYRANVTLIDSAGERSETIRVNHPWRVHGSPIYLIANGYAPTLTVRDAEGTIVFSESVPFIPQDAALTSLGVIKVPYGLEHDGEPTQLGLQGFFYPTKADLDSGAYTSNYPDLENPLLSLNVFIGDLGIDDGVPQSVYALDTSGMTQLAGRDLDVKPLELAIGETAELPDGMGTIIFEAAPRYASFDVMRNPAQEWVLITALLSVAGLLTSLFVPRRRVWVKALPDAGGVTLQYAALARGDDPTLELAVQELRERHRECL